MTAGVQVLEDRPLTATERYRRSKANLAGRPVPPHVKHGIYTAKVYRCSCPVCKTARAAAKHKVKNPWMYRKTRGHWARGVDATGSPVDVIWWPPSGATSADCRLAGCLHIDHREA